MKDYIKRNWIYLTTFAVGLIGIICTQQTNTQDHRWYTYGFLIVIIVETIFLSNDGGMNGCY